MDNYPASKVYT